MGTFEKKKEMTVGREAAGIIVAGNRVEIGSLVESGNGYGRGAGGGWGNQSNFKNKPIYTPTDNPVA